MSDAICVDASVAAKWVIRETDSDIARRLMRRALLEGVDIVAPAQILGEVANALYKRFRIGELTATDIRTLFADFLAIPTQSLQSDVFALRAIEIATESGLPTPYDAFYLALAEELDCELWTADARFHAAVHAEYERVRLLTEWPA